MPKGMREVATMRTPGEEEEFGPVTAGPMDEYVLKVIEKGPIRAKPGHPVWTPQIQQLAASGQVSEGVMAKFAEKNPLWAPIVIPAYNQYKQAVGQQRQITGMYDEYIHPATPGRPEIPAKPEIPFQTTEEQAFGLPALQGNVAQLAQAGSPAIPAREARNDPQGFINALARDPRNIPLAEQYRKLISGGEGGGLYGGIQYAYNPKTGQYVPYSIDKNTRTAVPITPPEGTQATVPMVPQQIALPGGATTVVQIPSRGVPTAGGGPKPSGLTPAHPLSMDAAGKVAMLTQASSDIDEANKLIFKNGKLDKGVIAGMNVPFTSGVGEESRTAYSMIHNAIAAKLRAETGAAANKDEVVNIANRFMPTILDTDKSAANKMKRLKQFMESSVDIVDPNRLYPRAPQEELKTTKPLTPAERKAIESEALNLLRKK